MEKKLILLVGGLSILLCAMGYLALASSAPIAEDHYEENNARETAARLPDAGLYKHPGQQDKEL